MLYLGGVLYGTLRYGTNCYLHIHVQRTRGQGAYSTRFSYLHLNTSFWKIQLYLETLGPTLLQPANTIRSGLTKAIMRTYVIFNTNESWLQRTAKKRVDEVGAIF